MIGRMLILDVRCGSQRHLRRWHRVADRPGCGRPHRADRGTRRLRG